MPYYQHQSVEFQISYVSNHPDKISFLSYVDKATIAYGVARALKASHDKNILHLNLKPSNILLDLRYPKLTDFSNQVTFTRSELMNMPISTLKYMAPEVRNMNEPTSKSDVYSFGLILNYMFTGKEPFFNIRNDSQLRNALLNTPNMQFTFDPNDYVNDIGMRNIISSCLNANPNDRPTFRELVSDLKPLCKENPQYHSYKKLLNDYELSLPSHFEQLQIIAKLPQSDNDSESFHFFIGDFFRTIYQFSTRYISIVFLCGPHQKGKSTIARAITGNQAFLVGNGSNGTTQNILMDPHGYTLQELRSRMSNSLYALFDDETSQIQQKDPVFFFIDSVGGGDEIDIKYNKSLIDKLNSVISSISTLCINPNTLTNNNAETSDYLRMIRKGQMLSNQS